MNDITPLGPLLSKGPKDPVSSSFPISPYLISFLKGFKLLSTIVVLHIPSRACLLEGYPSNYHNKMPTLPKPTPSSLLTTASSHGAGSPPTSIVGHLEVQYQGGGSKSLALPHPPLPKMLDSKEEKAFWTLSTPWRRKGKDLEVMIC